MSGYPIGFAYLNGFLNVVMTLLVIAACIKYLKK